MSTTVPPAFDENLLLDLPSPFKRVTIIGAGLIGGSFAWLMRERFGVEQLHITLIDQNEKRLQLALLKGIANVAQPQLPETFEGSHLVVLATHLDSNEALLPEVAKRIHGADVLVTDVGSVKRGIVERGFELLPNAFIGGHPMAGREKQGLENASSLLFFQKRFLITPHPDFKETRLLNQFKAFLELIGMVPVILDAPHHDEAMAYVSHLPQLYAVLLTNLIAQHKPGHLLSFHGGGIDDQLRLAASPVEMWGPVYERNADQMEIVLDEMIRLLQEMRAGLKNPDAMQQWFETSNTIHTAYQQLKQQQLHPIKNTII
jgi:prephenate dehydrogenase